MADKISQLEPEPKASAELKPLRRWGRKKGENKFEFRVAHLTVLISCRKLFGVEGVTNSELAYEKASRFPLDETMHRLSLVTADSLDVIVHIKNSGCSPRDAQTIPQLQAAFKTDTAQVDSTRGDSNSAPSEEFSIAQAIHDPKWSASVAGCRTASATFPTGLDRCIDPTECQTSPSQGPRAHRTALCHEKASEPQKNQDALLTQLPGKLSRQPEGLGLFQSHKKIVLRCLTERNPEMELGGQASVQNVPERALDPTPSKWEVHYNMAIQALQSKRFSCAVKHFGDSLQTMRATEINSLCMADAHKGLGLAYASDGKDGKARTHFQECLDLEERKPNSDVRLVETTELLGEVCYRAGDYGEAKRNFQRGFELSQAIWGSEHETSIHMLGSIAKTYHAAGLYNDALVAYQSVLQNTQQLFGNEALQTADAMNNIALVYRVLSEYNHALTLLESAFKIYSSSLGLGQMRSADVANNIGVIYLEQNMLSEAEDYFQRAVRINKRLFGNGHIKTTEALENLGITYQRRGQVRKALSCFANVLLISKDLPAGRAHDIRTANLYKNIGLLSRSLGQHRLTSRYFGKREKILENRRKLCRVGKASSWEREQSTTERTAALSEGK